MTIPESVRQHVRTVARNRCGYCLIAEEFVYASLEIEHIRPTAKGGTDDEENLWLACRRCNNFKRDQIDAIDPLSEAKVTLFNPRSQDWSAHFEW